MVGFLTCGQEWRETDAVWSRLLWDGCAEGEIGGDVVEPLLGEVFY
jgi:hypothetical protein